MVDPDAEVIEATDLKTGGTRLILRSELEADRGRFQTIRTRKEPGTVLTHHVRGRRGVRAGPGRERRRMSSRPCTGNGAARSASTARAGWTRS